MFYYINASIEIAIDEIKLLNDSVSFKTKYGDHLVRKTHASFLHDFTLDCNLNQTDTHLGGKTPDVVTDNEIIELSTTMSINKIVMSDKLSNKISKYSDIANKFNKTLKVIIVSRESLLSNLELPSQQCDQFIERFKMALHVREFVSNNFNLNLWMYEENTRIERILNVVLSEALEIQPKDDFEKSLDTKLPVVGTDDFEYFTTHCINTMVDFKVDTRDYTLDYKVSGKRFDYKRVIPVSLIIPKSYDVRLDYRTSLLSCSLKNEDLFEHQAKIVNMSQSSIKIEYNKDIEELIAMEDLPVPEKRKKGMYRFKVDLTNDQRIDMATFGVQAKKLLKEDKIFEKRRNDKDSFNFECPIDDIESFLTTNFLNEYKNYKVRDFSIEAYEDWINDLRSFNFNDRAATSLNENEIKRLYENFSSSTLIQYCKFVQALFTEINLSVRENLDKDIFIVKPIPSYHCDVYIKTVGSSKPIFFFIVAKPDFMFEQMTVGVKYKFYDEDEICISEWSSVKLRDIENYLSINAKMISTMAYILQTNNVVNMISSHVNYILLLLLSNKDRDEEIVTLTRYIYMRSLSLTDNVTTLTSKLPTCLRSRLNVYQVHKTLYLMHYLHRNKPEVGIINGDRDVLGLIDIFGYELNFKQALNFCYYGYVVNKTKQTEDNQSSKLIDKILEYDLKVEDGSKLSGVNFDELDDHFHDNRILAVICYLAEIKIKQTYGENYKNHFKIDFLKHMSKQNLISLATIKASAKNDLPSKLEDDAIEKLKKRRPKVTEAIKQLTDNFGQFEHPIELVNYCVREIHEKDSFNVELFSKDQHAGIREIYVVDIKVRIIQWFLESISRCLCKLFDSETMTNPAMKDTISQRLTRNAILKLEDPVMLCRSGDASKWSQTQNVTKFYQVLTKFLPEEFHKIVKSILILWFRKKIYLPASLINICLSNPVNLDNDTINFIKSVYSGENNNYRLKKNEPFLRVRTGFMQGILHFTSSFFHTIVQEGFVCFKNALVNKLFPETKNSQNYYNIILQGSDDNSETMIISKTLYRKCPRFFKILVQLKDLMSPSLGIKVSKEKTASCVPFLMEYNSTWELAGKFVMPTIKFVFVSCDIPQKQTLVGRQEYYYSLLTNCLEKGATIKTCNVIRLAQAEQHYLQLGYLHNQLFDTFFNKLSINKSPALGYFMFEPTIVTGLLGFDFMLYFHSIETSFSRYIRQEEKEVPVQILNNLGYKSIADYTISKFHYKRYDEIMKNLDLGPVEKSRENVNLRPEILYANTNNVELELDLINLKMNDFSVKESLTSRFSKSEMFSSLIYILSRPVCYFNKRKSSLIKLCTELNNESSTNVLSRSLIKRSFSRSQQYDEILLELKPMINSNVLINKTYIQRGSSKIKLLEGLNDESYKLLDLCKAKWFNLSPIPLSERVIDKYFKEAQNLLPWLKNTEEETKSFLNCDSFQLYYYLLNSFKDSKHIKLLDTPGKKGNLRYLISRIADSNKKLVYVPNESQQTSNYQKTVRSNIKFVCDFPYDYNYKLECLKFLINEYQKTSLRNNEKQIVTLILDVLNNDENKFQNDVYKMQNDLNLAIFIKPQIFDENSGIWKGEGILLAKAGSLIYELHVYDSEIIKIAVNDLNLARNRFSIILKTIKELNFKMNKSKDKPSLKLNSTGILVDLYGAELIEVPELTFHVDKLNNLDLRIEHDRIKIVTKSRVKDINKKSLLDDLPLIEMALIKDDKDVNKEIWVPIEKVKRSQRIINTCFMNENEATQYITVCSLKTKFFNFNKLHKPLIKMNKLSEYFWKQNQDFNKLIIKVNEIVNENNIKSHYDFCSKLNLSLNCSHVFRNLLLGKFKSRDEIIKDLDVNNVEEDADWNLDVFKDMHKPEAYVDLIEQLEMSDLLPTLMSIDDDLFNQSLDDEKIMKLCENISKSEKGFYLHFSSNDVLETKIFETILVKIKSKNKNVDKLILEGDGFDCYDNLMKQILICLFNIKGAIANQSEISLKNVGGDLKIILEDPASLSSLLINEDDINKYELNDDVLECLADLITLQEDEIKQLKDTFSKQRSFAMKSRTTERIRRGEDYLFNLIAIKNFIDNKINETNKEKEKEKEKEFEKGKESSKDDLEYGSMDMDEDFDTPRGLKDLDDYDSDFEIGMGGDRYYLMDKLTNTYDREFIANNFPNLSKDFKSHPVKGDGGCLFYSLLFSLLPNYEDLFRMHMYSLRESIVKIILKFPVDKLLMIRESEGKDYPKRLLKNGEWGDIYCILAFGILTNSIIHVKINDEWVSSFGCYRKFYNKDIFIQSISSTHFEPLIPLEDYDKFVISLNEIIETYGVPQF